MRIFLFLFITLIVTSCNIFRSSIMLRTGCKYPYSQPPDTPLLTYKLSTNDIIQFRVLSNDGFKLIDFTGFGDNTGNWSTANASNYQTYIIDYDSTAKLPLLGRTILAGRTIREAEKYLEDRYSTYYNKPFVMLNVSNRRVMVFPGGEGAAKIIPLTYPNTTLLEALAIAGGISSTGRARKVKLIRGNLRNPQVFLINLSTIDGMKKADLVLQANDIIYVEPSLRFTQSVLAELTPITALLSNIALIYAIVSGTITK